VPALKAVLDPKLGLCGAPSERILSLIATALASSLPNGASIFHALLNRAMNDRAVVLLHSRLSQRRRTSRVACGCLRGDDAAGFAVQAVDEVWGTALSQVDAARLIKLE